MADTRYIILELSDANALIDAIAMDAVTDPVAAAVIGRIRMESGADIEDIASQLKATPICLACEVEGQQHSCESIGAKKLGRRLSRLIERANAHRSEPT